MLAVLVFLGIVGVALAQTISPSEVNLADADLTLVGEENGDWAGYFASPAGDVNADGLGDIIIGAPMAGNKVCPWPEDPCPGIPKGEGETYLILGRPESQWPASPMNLANADASFLGCEAKSMTGRQIYTAGDVNGDGYDDFLISGWKCGSNFTGKAYLFLGRPNIDWGAEFPVEGADASFLGENAWDFLAYYTSTAGDVNGDGYDDFLITSTHYDDGAVQDPGKTYLILGRSAADWGKDFPVEQADASFIGEAEDDRIGRAATGVGDVNGDGYDDFLVGSISNDEGGINAGQNYLFLGRDENDPSWWGTDAPVTAADASFIGESGPLVLPNGSLERTGDESGRRVARAGDVNGDGLSDFLIGAALNDHDPGNPLYDAGAAYLILGRAAADWGMDFPLALADAKFLGEARRDQAGRRVSGAGDVNNDGYDDFLVGAPHNNRGGEIAGAAYLIYGRAEADWGRAFPLAEADVAYLGKPDIGVAGYDVAWIGDFSADGVDDLLVAAYGGRNDVNVPGEVYVLLGSEVGAPPDMTPPETAITSGPPDPSSSPEASFEFTGDDGSGSGVAGFECQLDGGGWTPCSSPQVYTGLADGSHTFEVYAIDNQGNADPSPASYPWTVETVSPPGDAPLPLEFIDLDAADPSAPGGRVAEWHRLTGTYWDPNGWGDIDRAQLVVGQDPADTTGVYVKYEPATNGLFLQKSDGSGWLGPCAPRELGSLDNGIVLLSCRGSNVTLLNNEEIRISWSAKFIQNVQDPIVHNVYLQAVDLSGDDSGAVEFGTWTLSPR
jgi:hypothetical protein